MSIEAMKWAMGQTIVTNPTDRHVLLVMANNARDDGSAAFPAVSTIAKITGLSERTVKYSISRLLDAGAIRRGSSDVVAAHIKRADQRPNNYDLAMTDAAHLAPERGAFDGKNEVQQMHPAPERGAFDDINGVHLTTERGAPAAPDPNRTPPREPSIVGGQAAKPRKRRSQLPANFYPNENGVKRAEDAGLSLAIELQAFKDHHAAKGSLMKNWQAAWGTWVGNAVKFGHTAKHRAERGTLDGIPGIDDVDPKPQWCIDAGFANVWEAESAMCWKHNAHKFRNGERMAA